jgi:hypothetical protein
MRIHTDNARVHAARDCIAETQRLKMTRLPEPAYSPDLSPCEFWFFGFAKQAIQDEVFDNTDQLMQRLHTIFDQVTFENLDDENVCLSLCVFHITCPSPIISLSQVGQNVLYRNQGSLEIRILVLPEKNSLF